MAMSRFLSVIKLVSSQSEPKILVLVQDSSAHTYLERRFDRSVRIFASLSFILLTSLYLAIVVYAPSLALSQVTGLNVDLAILITFSVCIFYTSLGGIKAVIWTNVFQVRDTFKERECLEKFVSAGGLHVDILPGGGHCW